MKPEVRQHREIVQRIIDLANQLKDEGAPVSTISDALMVASGFYATYAAAGNEGGLTDAGVEKVVDRYRQRLKGVQEAKRRQAQEPPIKGQED